MDATIKELWLIVECPHCHRPLTVNKFVDSSGVVWNLHEQRSRTCPYCDKHYIVRVQEPEQDLGPEFDVAGVVP